VHLLIVVYKRDVSFGGQGLWRLRSSHAESVSTAPCLLESRHSKKQS
jgi:hypothetical protein